MHDVWGDLAARVRQDRHTTRGRARAWQATLAAMAPGAPAMGALIGLGPAADPVRRYCRRHGLALTVNASDVVAHLPLGHKPYWRQRGEAAYTWADLGVPPGTRPDEVRARYEAPGIVVEPHQVTVHAGRFGAHSVYARPIASGWVVSDVADVVESMDPGRLEPDWSAWLTQLVFWSKLDEGAAARGTTRLSWGSSLVLDRRRGLVRRGARVLRAVQVRDDVAPADVADALVAAVRRLPDDQPIDVPLSGGFDSRALAAALWRAGRDCRTWSISKDDGRDDEQQIARAVAAVLDVPNHEVLPTTPVEVDLLCTVRRTQYATALHGWMFPLQTMVRRAGRVVVDGLLGDTLLRTYSSRPYLLDCAPGQRLRDELRNSYIYRPPCHPLLPRGAVDWANDVARSAYAATIDDLVDEPTEGTLTAMIARGAYAIACSPLGMARGPAAVSFPFLDPDVVDLGLAVPVERKVDMSFYRQVLAALHPDVAALPATTQSRPEPTLAQRNHSGAALDFHRAAILRAAQVPGLLAEEFVTTLTAAPIDELRPWLASTYGIAVPVRNTWIGGLSVLGTWLADHEDRLGTVEAPWPC